jgi:hypothetical protein
MNLGEGVLSERPFSVVELVRVVVGGLGIYVLGLAACRCMMWKLWLWIHRSVAPVRALEGVSVSSAAVSCCGADCGNVGAAVFVVFLVACILHLGFCTL